MRQENSSMSMNRRDLICFVGLVTLLISKPAFAQAGAREPDGTESGGVPVRIVIIGDSTVCDYPKTQPTRGWGQFIEERFKEGTVKVMNLAASGRSTKTFIQEGRWEKALLEKPDYVLIQFGHNDSHAPDHAEATDAGTDYKDYLRRYV